jgi:poly-D-alanine transfer protein DltD
VVASDDFGWLGWINADQKIAGFVASAGNP